MHDESLNLGAAAIGSNARPRTRRGAALVATTRQSAANGSFKRWRSAETPLRPKRIRFGIIGALLLAAGPCVSCRSLPPLPPVDLSAPGYRVQQGQALWKPTKTRPELAGELLLATKTNGDFFVQFMKTPFTLAKAQSVGDQWQIDLGSGDYHRSGHGPPPVRFVWFQLSAALAGAGVSGNWSFDRVTTNSWRLENHRTGEALEGGFFP